MFGSPGGGGTASGASAGALAHAAHGTACGSLPDWHDGGGGDGGDQKSRHEKDVRFSARFGGPQLFIARLLQPILGATVCMTPGAALAGPAGDCRPSCHSGRGGGACRAAPHGPGLCRAPLPLCEGLRRRGPALFGRCCWHVCARGIHVRCLCCSCCGGGGRTPAPDAVGAGDH